MSDYNLMKRQGDNITSGSMLKDAFDNWSGSNERWLFVAPHDDDLCLGAGLLMQKALEEGIPMHILITTDGRMGYGQSTPKEEIVEVRKRETLESFKILDIDDVRWLNFPDGSLNQHTGIKEAEPNDPCVIEGHTGMQNAYTYYLRKFKPTRVFVPAGSDLHPDHKIVYQELLISLFHASGDIWPQLGPQLTEVPAIYEMAIYCDFPGEPTIKLEAPESAFNKKLDSILAYQSQQQIAALVENVRQSGPIEFYRPADFNLYVPSKYEGLFIKGNAKNLR